MESEWFDPGLHNWSNSSNIEVKDLDLTFHYRRCRQVITFIVQI
jgi:hypothetical protein